MLIITIMIMALIQTVEQQSLFNIILTNGLLSFFITVPCFVYKSSNINKKYFFFIPVVFFIALFLHNYLILFKYENFVFLTRVLLFFVLFIPVFIKHQDKKESDIDKKLQKTGITTFCIVVSFALLPFLLYKWLSKVPSLFIGYYGLFTILYQIPGILYCKARLYRGYKKTKLTALTKREQEVVLEICRGLKYEEIGEKLFISLSAVKKHTYNIYRKLGIKNNRELILLTNKEKEEISE
jgi:DNA-binding CsgD family transcriptional regulator